MISLEHWRAIIGSFHPLVYIRMALSDEDKRTLQSEKVHDFKDTYFRLFLIFTMIILFRAGDIENNPGPIRGTGISNTKTGMYNSLLKGLFINFEDICCFQ